MVNVAPASAAHILIRLFLTLAAVLALALPHSGLTGGLGGVDMHMIHAGAAHDPAAASICAQACTGTKRLQEPVMFAPFRRASVIIWFGEPASAWATTDPAPAFRPPNLLLVA